MRKFRLVSVLIACLLVISLIGTTVSAEPKTSVKNSELAERLKFSGFFKGSDMGFELERVPTRIEGAIMLVRMLGKEQEVLSNVYTHPFTDVPEWAKNYVGYLVENGLSNGVSEELYGSNNPITAHQYYTFILRSLGYDDANGDFQWNTSLEKAKSLNMINHDEYNNLLNNEFLRDDTVLATYRGLLTNIKNNDVTLIDSLVQNEVISRVSAELLKGENKVYNLLISASKALENLDNYTIEQLVTGSSVQDGEKISIVFAGSTYIDQLNERFYGDWTFETGTPIMTFSFVIKQYVSDGNSYGYSNFTNVWAKEEFNLDDFEMQYSATSDAIVPTVEMCEKLSVQENETQYIIEGIITESVLTDRNYESIAQKEVSDFKLSIVIDKETNLPISIIGEDSNEINDDDFKIQFEILDANNTTIILDPALVEFIDQE